MKPIIFANKATVLLDRTLNTGQVYSDADINTKGNLAADAYNEGFIPGKPISPILLNTVLRQISTVLCGIFAKVLENISKQSESDTYKPEIKEIIDEEITSWSEDNIISVVTKLSTYLNYITKIIEGTRTVKTATSALNYNEVSGTIKKLFEDEQYNLDLVVNGSTEYTYNKVASYYNTGTMDNPSISSKTIDQAILDIYNRINK